MHRIPFLALCIWLILPATDGFASHTIWQSPTAIATGDGSVTITTAMGGYVRLASRTTGDFKEAFLDLTLPDNLIVEGVTVCYRVDVSDTYVSALQYLNLRAPDSATTVWTDPTHLASVSPTCYATSGMPAYQPNGTGIVKFRMNFASTTHYIYIGAVGVIVSDVTTAVPPPREGDQKVSVRAEPNPLGPDTRITFSLDAPGYVNVKIYDASGREVRSLEDATLPSGPHEVVWDGRDNTGRFSAPGAYFANVLLPGRSAETRKLILVR